MLLNGVFQETFLGNFEVLCDGKVLVVDGVCGDGSSLGVNFCGEVVVGVCVGALVFPASCGISLMFGEESLFSNSAIFINAALADSGSNTGTAGDLFKSKCTRSFTVFFR